MNRLARTLALALGIVVVLAGFALARPGGGSSFKGSSSRSSSSSSGSSRSGSSSSSSSSSGSFRSGSSTSSSSSSGGSRSSTSSSSSGGSYSSTSSGGGYSGSSSSSSSSGGSVAAFVFFFLMVGGIVVIGGIWSVASRSRPSPTWSTVAYGAGAPPPPVTRVSPRRELERLRETDPNFSLALFDDFTGALYTEIKVAQGRGQLARYAPYLDPSAMSELGSPGGEIVNVIVGSASIEEVEGLDASSQHVRARVAFETNYGVRSPQGERGVYSQEEWVFARRRDAVSRTPDKARVIGCPNCGSPLDVQAAGQCKYCGAAVQGGTRDWMVETIMILATEPRGPMLTSNTVEQGTNLPTIVDPVAQQRFAALQASDPQTTWPSLTARVAHIFTEFQAAWAARDLASMRPYMSDALFATQTFWVEEYKRQKLRNITENAQVSNMQLAAATADAFYDSVTIRIWASSLDYTVSDETNQIVSGTRSQPRAYSEYWTLIRGRGAKGPARVDKLCPKCGAPLSVSMGGNCTYCQSKVTSGEFDWVLSRIEQDEVYRG